MFVNTKIFMELVERLTTLSIKLQELELRMESIEKKSLTDNSADLKSSGDDIAKIYHELMNGVIDEKMGRVIYTDGRE